MKALFIGGTGNISAACSKLALEKGIDLYILNRGNRKRPELERAVSLTTEINNLDQFEEHLKGELFDEDPSRIRIDERNNQLIDTIIEAYRQKAK